MRLLLMPEPVPRRAQIWLGSVDLMDPLNRNDWFSLSQQENEQVGRFYHHADRVRSFASCPALRRFLGDQLQRDPVCLQSIEGWDRDCASLQGHTPDVPPKNSVAISRQSGG